LILMFVERHGGSCTFIADELTREGGTWTATGRWKYSSGRLSEPPATYTWPTHRVLEVRHDYAEGGPV
jgi:hypothetical protein